MILANTKANGYALGLALYWPDDPAQLSTGLIQGISISLLLNQDEPIPALSITKYAIQNERVSLAISGDGVFCSLDVSIPHKYTVYALESTSPNFIRGWVGMYPGGADRLLNLTGAVVNPLYIHASIRQTVDIGSFCLRNKQQIVASTTLIGLTVASTADIAVTSTTTTSGGIVYQTSINDSITPAVTVDSSSIYYINGSYVSGGDFKIDLPAGWTVMGNGLCARIGNTSETPSCVAVDYITENLGPQNFAGDYNPLESAFSGGVLDMQPIYDGTVRFNKEYESGGSGLPWNEFSEKHDGTNVNAD